MAEENLFFRALELPAAERQDFLQRECGDDSALLEKIEALLALDESDETVVDRPCEESDGVSAHELMDPEATAVSGISARLEAAADQPIAFGDYEIEREIARGAMGVVYRARQKSLNRLVALKMIRGAFTLDENEVARFRLEAEAAAGLDHPNIVPVYEIGEHEGQQYFAMKLIEGGTLANRREEFRGDHRDAARLMAKVARAIHAAHQQGILHRDIKPGNILVDESGEPHVTDFGLAKQLESESGLTLSGQIMGTPFYMAPEQAAAGGPAASMASDVYSLGAVFYELLAGKPPHQGKSMVQTLRLVMDEEPGSLQLADPSIDRDLGTIIFRCLEKLPARRYPSASALADELERWLNGEPILARPAGTVERVIKWARRKPAIAAAWGLAAVLLMTFGIGGPIVAVHQSKLRQEADDEHALAEARAEENRRNLYFAEMNLASQFGTDSGGIRRLRALTEKWIPEPGEDDLRGWEWHYLDARHRHELLSFDGHDGRVGSVAWSPDGRRVASSDETGHVRIWEADSGSELVHFRKNAGKSVFAVAWSPDGTVIASSHGYGRMSVWDADTGVERWTLWDGNGSVSAVAWRPNGRHIAFGCSDGAVRIRNGADGRVIQTLPGTGGPVLSVAWSPDGLRLATGTAGTSGMIWEGQPGEALLEPAGEAPFRRVAWSPDGRRLAGVGEGSREILIIEPGSGETLHRLEGHGALVTGLAWSPDGSRLATASWDETVWIWNADTGEAGLVIPDTRPILGIAWDPKGGRAAFGSGEQVRVCDVRTPETPSAEFPGRGPGGLHWSPGGERFAVSGVDGRLQIRDAGSLAVRTDLRGHRGTVCDLHWSPDGGRVVSAGYDLIIWNPDSGAEQLRPSGHAERIEVVRWSPDGGRLATVESDDGVRIWDAADGSKLADLSGEALELKDLRYAEWSPDGRWLALAAREGGIRILEANGLTPIPSPKIGKEVYGGLIWSPGSDRLAVGSLSGEIRIVDREAGGNGITLLGHDRAVTALAWSPDGSRIASAGSDRSLRIWDAVSGSQCLALIAHEGAVLSLSWSPDGSRILSRGEDGMIKLWDSVKR